MPAELDNIDPGMDQGPEMGAEPQGDVIGTHGQTDREGAMAKADLFKLANYSHKLYQQINDEDQLEAWVQAKITKAADYIASVYHYLEYEMKFTEYGHHLDNSDTLSEGQKSVLKARLVEAKEKMKELKKAQAEKVAEEKSSTGGEITRPKPGVTRHTHNPARFTDEPHAEPASKVKARSAAEKAGEKAMDKADEKESKAWGKANPGKQTIMKGGVKTTNEAAKPDYIDADGDGNEKESMKKAFSDKKKAPFKKVKEGLKGGQKKLDVDKDGDIEADDLADLRAKKKKVAESAKPSAGLSKEKKSATVKKAKAGGDIGKPGKGFDKLAKKAGGGEKGEKIAAAAMWKNIKEAAIEEAAHKVDIPAAERKAKGGDWKVTQKDLDDKASDNISSKEGLAKLKAKTGIKESTEFDRMKEQLGRLNRSETPALVESREVDKLKALSQLLKG